MKLNLAYLSTLFLLTTGLASGGARAADATITTFTGGDPGEGLDLQGNFTYAVNVGPDGGAGKVGDASFSSDSVAGVTITANNQIAKGGWGAVNYGDTDNDKNLSLAMNSIRWAAAPTVVTVKLKVEKGAEYKLQLLFHEDCCLGRGFNVVLDDNVETTNFMPGPTQNGGDSDPTTFAETKNKIGSVITKQFTAANDEVVIVLDGPSADSGDISDHNAILNGFTLERLTAVADTDTDGLPDDWENKFFSNTDSKPTDDPDQDTLPNSQELTLGTDPTKTDSDGDGLTDGDEVNKYKTDPTKVGDTDGDLLTDGAEVTIYKTDPTKADTDGDGAGDYYEIHFLTDPTDANSKPTKTTANLFYGPDSGQGLDFEGEFPYAISFGNPERDPLGGQIKNANFTADNVEGVTLVASQVADNWNVDVNYGDSAEQQVLSSVLASIRWSDSGNATTPDVTLTLGNLKVGASYKMQLLFGERLWARGFNVSINNRLIAQEFAPYQWQGGFVGPGNATPRTNGVVITHTFIATGTNALVYLDGRPVRDPSMGDHNAIINGATLELVAAAADTDNDSLWDAWEMEVFGNLDQKGDGDPDSDGLINSAEFTANADPTKADTDGDGLNDGNEVNTTKSDPAKADSDGDGLNDAAEVAAKSDPNKADTDADTLSDGDEVNNYKTDPTKADTDGDGSDDGKEVNTGDDPTKQLPKTTFSNIVIQAFSGGDPGDGLDLQGNFLYAFNVSSVGAAGKAGDADFTADDAPGITVTAPNNIANWDTPEYGDTPADNVIEKVTQSIRYGPTVRLDLTGLVPDSTYKLQLLFYEQCCATRGFNIYGDGQEIAVDFSPPEIQGGVDNTLAGAVVAAEFVTQRDKLTILCTINGRTREDLTDPNAILDGVTLEILKGGIPATPPAIKVAQEGGNVVITFDGTLQGADAVTGPYADVPGTSPATIPATGTQKFYRSKK